MAGHEGEIGERPEEKDPLENNDNGNKDKDVDRLSLFLGGGGFVGNQQRSTSDCLRGISANGRAEKRGGDAKQGRELLSIMQGCMPARQQCSFILPRSNIYHR